VIGVVVVLLIVGGIYLFSGKNYGTTTGTGNNPGTGSGGSTNEITIQNLRLVLQL